MNAERIKLMKARLSELHPQSLEIEDQSHLHVGHAGARDGRGHFALSMSSECFIGQSMIQRHRMIYAALGELMQTDIHALTIDAKLPNETSPIQVQAINFNEQSNDRI